MRCVLYARVFLDSGQERIASADLRATSEFFDGRVAGLRGYIDRSISAPSGIPESSDASIRIADTDGVWRDLLATQVAQLRLVDVFLIEEGAEISYDSQQIYTGTVDRVVRGPGYLDLVLVDRFFQWLEEEIPGTLTHENFTGLSSKVDSVFLPWYFGAVQSPASNRSGAVSLPFMDESQSQNFHKFGVSAHEIFDTRVYVKKTTEQSFSQITNFTMNTEVITIQGYTTTATFLSMDYDQTLVGAQVRADVWAFAGDSVVGTVPRDFVSAFEEIVQVAFIKTNINGGIPPFAQDELDALKITLETVIPYPVTSPMRCDGAIVQALKFRDILARLLQSGQLDMYQKKSGELTLAFSNQANANRVDHDEWLIVRDSFTDGQGDNANRLPLRYLRNYGENDWSGSLEINDDDAQLELGPADVDTSGDPLPASTGFDHSTRVIRESLPLDLWFVRDRLTAEFVGNHYLGFLVWSAKRQTFRLPAPETLDNLELAARIGITMAQHGYANQDVKILGISLRTATLELELQTQIHAPQPFVVSDFFDAYQTSQLWFWAPPELQTLIAFLVGDRVDYDDDPFFWSLYIGGSDYGYGISTLL